MARTDGAAPGTVSAGTSSVPPDLQELAAVAATWVRATLGARDARVSIIPEAWMPRLRVFANEDRLGGDVTMAIPLVTAHKHVGVLEVRAPRACDAERWALVESGAGQLAIAVSEILARREVRATIDAVDLGAALLRAGGEDAAIRETARHVRRRVGGPVAAWMPSGGEHLLRPAFVLGDPDGRCLAALAALGPVPRWTAMAAETRGVVLASFRDAANLRSVDVIDAGRVFVLADRPPGGSAIDVHAVGTLLASAMHRRPPVRPVGRAEDVAARPTSATPRELTKRELEVLAQLASGSSTTAAAESLHISTLTVRSHVKSILYKLGVHSKLEAVTYALRHGLIELSAPA